MAQDPRALLRQAETQVSKASGGFSFFGGREERWEQAAELYTNAANAFRMQNNPVEGGQAFEKAAEIQTSNLNSPDDAAQTYTNAFNVYRTIQPLDAVRVMDIAITTWTTKGNFRRAATHKEKVAELYELEINDLKKAIDNYKLAAQWYENDGAAALANKLYLKIADLSATEGDYYESIRLYEQVAKGSIQNNLLKWSVKEYYLKSGLCLLAVGDMVATRRSFQNYCDNDPTFASTREFQLLSDLADAVEAGDTEAFEGKLFAFDQMSRLDKWKTNILIKVKNSIQEQGEDFS
ncbi:soluble NSF attachment protein [Calycina marina]|uniref:Soluble NSF attachment protein n=1 Tax=Calycina marina TaxID=1763456 RepID=A0A9P7Z7T0_9HELO|nr:soluble NSF attachment protein [Calycina marina]